MKQLANTPPKWTSDWFPEEFKIRKYIFDTWRKVCVSFWFQEYLWPLVENIEIWKAKSWEDVWWSELTRITNREWELSDLAIRPEMTPTVTRMVSRIWKETDKPVKWFSIANFYRNEKPQKWRNREFWQLNVDIFWEESLSADIETLVLALELMRAFNPPKWTYKLRLNHRELINWFFEVELGIKDREVCLNLIRLMDKYEKMDKNTFDEKLLEYWVKNVHLIHSFMTAKNLWELKERFVSLASDSSFSDFEEIFKSLENLWYGDEIEFSASLIRWFDYYDAMIFEMFDTNKENPRALFGWWRYNWLADIFWVKDWIPAVWFAPWDETMKLFLEWHGLIENVLSENKERYYLPMLENISFVEIQKIANSLRNDWKDVQVWLSSKKLQKALKYADKNNFSHTVIYWEEEKQNWIYVLKDMKKGESLEVKL